jgi:hypothetical protein
MYANKTDANPIINKTSKCQPDDNTAKNGKAINNTGIKYFFIFLFFRFVFFMFLYLFFYIPPTLFAFRFPRSIFILKSYADLLHSLNQLKRIDVTGN